MFRPANKHTYKKSGALFLAALLACLLLLPGCGNDDGDSPLLPETPTDISAGDAAGQDVSAGDATGQNVSTGDTAGQHVSDGDATGQNVSDGDAAGQDVSAGNSTGDTTGQHVSDGDTDTQNPAESGPEQTSEVLPEQAAGSNTAAPSGALSVNGTTLTDSSGNAVQLRGISTHGLAWFPDYVNEDCFRQLRDEWNVNVIRLAMYTAEYGGYCTGGDQENLKQLIKNGVSYATSLNMYVIIDWHILSDGNPNTHKEAAKEFFAEMAQLYADQTNVLYEICNEPNGGTGWSEIKAYAEEIIPVIRAYDENAVIIVGTPNWSQYVDQAAADPITGYDNIMYSLHFYAATHKDSLRNTMTAAIEAGLPVFVTEYGICDASGNGAIDETQAERWISIMDAYGVSYVAWNLSNKSETSAILASGCGKTSGFTEDDLSASGKWLYQMLTGKSAGALAPPQTGSASGSDSNSGSTSQDTSAEGAAPGGSVPDGSFGPAASDGSSAAGGAVTFTASLVNSWESDGRTFYQYDLTVSNTSGAACSAWAVDVAFSDAIALSDGWNGDYSVNGRTLHIVSKDYNGSIPSGGSTGNIGFIISGVSGLKIAE